MNTTGKTTLRGRTKGKYGNYKRNYKKGMRNTLIETMLTAGMTTTKGLTVLGGSTRKYNLILNEMLKSDLDDKDKEEQFEREDEKEVLEEAAKADREELDEDVPCVIDIGMDALSLDYEDDNEDGDSEDGSADHADAASPRPKKRHKTSAIKKSSGLVTVIKLDRYEQATYLRNIGLYGNEYLEDLAEGYREYYEKFGQKINNEARLKYVNNKDLSGDAKELRQKTYRNRSIRAKHSSEVFHYMKGAGIPALYSEKPCVYWNGMSESLRIHNLMTEQQHVTPAYYSTAEILADAHDKLNYHLTAKKSAKSRMLGAVFGEGSAQVYPVLYAERSIEHTYVETEREMLNCVCKVAQDWGYHFLQSTSSGCILLGYEDSVALSVMDEDKVTHDKDTEVFTTTTCPFGPIYYLPFSSDSQHLAVKMTKENWQKTILTDLLGTGYNSTAIDFDDDRAGVLKYVFCIPNLRRLQKVRRYAFSHSTAFPEIICYNWQQSLVDKVMAGCNYRTKIVWEHTPVIRSIAQIESPDPDKAERKNFEELAAAIKAHPDDIHIIYCNEQLKQYIKAHIDTANCRFEQPAAEREEE